MEPEELQEIFDRTADAREKTVSEIRDKWGTTDLKLSQIHRRTRIGYFRLREFLVMGKTAQGFKNQELVAIHTALQ